MTVTSRKAEVSRNQCFPQCFGLLREPADFKVSFLPSSKISVAPVRGVPRLTTLPKLQGAQTEARQTKKGSSKVQRHRFTASLTTRRRSSPRFCLFSCRCVGFGSEQCPVPWGILFHKQGWCYGSASKSDSDPQNPHKNWLVCTSESQHSSYETKNKSQKDSPEAHQPASQEYTGWPKQERPCLNEAESGVGGGGTARRAVL